jgi:hypothetical protein
MRRVRREREYLSHQEIALRFRRNNRWALDACRAGDFGPDVIEDGGDYLVPVPAYNAYCAARKIFDEQTGALKPVYARTSGEARRKLVGLRNQKPSMAGQS